MLMITTPIKILYVEDEYLARQSVSDILKSNYGNECVYTASDGSEAISIFNDVSPDILITDIKMSPMDGIELVELIRMKNKSIPIIVVSAYEKNTYKMDHMKVCEYLIKPVTKFTLLYTIETCLNGKKSDEK